MVPFLVLKRREVACLHVMLSLEVFLVPWDIFCVRVVEHVVMERIIYHGSDVDMGIIDIFLQESSFYVHVEPPCLVRLLGYRMFVRKLICDFGSCSVFVNFFLYKYSLTYFIGEQVGERLSEAITY